MFLTGSTYSYISYSQKGEGLCMCAVMVHNLCMLDLEKNYGLLGEQEKRWHQYFCKLRF